MSEVKGKSRCQRRIPIQETSARSLRINGVVFMVVMVGGGIEFNWDVFK